MVVHLGACLLITLPASNLSQTGTGINGVGVLASAVGPSTFALYIGDFTLAASQQWPAERQLVSAPRRCHSRGCDDVDGDVVTLTFATSSHAEAFVAAWADLVPCCPPSASSPDWAFNPGLPF